MQATTEDEEEEQEIEDEKEQEDDAQVAITVNLISGQRVKEFQTAPIRNFTPDAVFALYLCYQFIFLTALSGKYIGYFTSRVHAVWPAASTVTLGF